jgi:hypothetical protein
VRFYRRVTDDFDQADGFDSPIRQLWCGRGLAGQDLSGGMLGVNRVALA